MKRLLPLLAAIALVLGLAGSVLAADESANPGRVLVAVSGDIDLPAGEHADALIVVNGTATVAGTVETLVVVEGTAIVTGAALDSVAIVNGSLDLRAGTTVAGDVMRLNGTVDTATGVEIGGSIRDMAGDVAAWGLFLGAAAIVLWIGFGIATLLVGLLVAGLAARQVRSATALIGREPVTVALAGLLAIVLPPIAAIALTATVIGIPTAIGLVVVLWPAVAFIGYIVAAIWLGEWLLGRRGPEAAPADRPYAAAAIGLVVAFVIGLVPLVSAVLSIVGLGAVILAAWRTLRGGQAPRPSVTQPHPAPIG
jgi:hypothetical protein